jgi:hypothetical protein
MSYDPCETVFTIPGLRLLILSYSLDKVKNKKKTFFERKFPRLIKFHDFCKNCFDIIILKILMFIFHIRFQHLR